MAPNRNRSTRDPDAVWPRLEGWIRTILERNPLSLEQTQQVYDAASDQPLSAAAIRAIAADVLETLAQRELEDMGTLAQQLSFTAHALLIPPSDLVRTDVVCGGTGLPAEIGPSEINEIRVPVANVAPAIPREATRFSHGSMVFDIWPAWDELDVYRVRSAGQGAMRWDVYLDGRNWEAHPHWTAMLGDQQRNTKAEEHSEDWWNN